MNILFIGWCKHDNHDKVWGIIDKGNNICQTFWGRRGKKFQTNSKMMSVAERHALVRSKLNKGYCEVAKEDWDTVYDHFGRDVFKLLLKG